jgi:hypothetical protein
VIAQRTVTKPMTNHMAYKIRSIFFMPIRSITRPAAWLHRRKRHRPLAS